MYIHLQLLDNIRPLWSSITIRYSGAPISPTVKSLLKWRVQLAAHLARLTRWSESEAFDAEPPHQCALQSEREHFSITSFSASETGVCSFFLYWKGGVTIGSGRGQRSANTHLQEVILDVAVEGAAQPHRVVLPHLVGLQVETKLLPAVLQTQPKRRLHLEEHGWQLLDVEGVCGEVGGFSLDF